MNSVEASGRTIEEAVALAASQMGVSREEIDVEVLQEPRPALLGLGGREARVRVTRRPTDGALAGRVAAEVLDLMGYTVTADVQEAAGRTTVALEGQEIGAVIGRDGQTLDAIELLVGLQLAKRLGRRAHVTIDIEGYRAKREAVLEKVAGEAARRAVRERKPIFLEPMDPRDRRTVHLTLQHDPRVTTSSVGEDQDRRVVVHPSGPGDAPSDGLPADDDLGE